MKTSKKIAVVVLAVLCLAIIGNGIYLSQTGKTVDCAGVVDFVNLTDQTVKITDINNVEYLLKIKFYTSLKDLDGNKIDIEDIEVGDHITANYRGKWKSADISLNATYIKVTKLQEANK